MSHAYCCPVSGCSKECKLAHGLIQHINLFHYQQSLASSPGESSGTTFRRWTHLTLTGRQLFVLANLSDLVECLACPCNKDGHYLLPRSHPPPCEPLDTTPENLYHPFEDCLTFEFADFHFSE
jgi:hypothetical protein